MKYDARYLGTIQDMGARKAEELNTPTMRPKPEEDLISYCPYKTPVEAIAWGAGYWAWLAGHYSGYLDKIN